MKLRTKLTILFLTTSIIPILFILAVDALTAKIISIIVIFLVAIVAFVTAKSITDPVSILMKNVELMSKGQLEVKIPTSKGWDEISQLSNSFSVTAEKLNESYKKLYKQTRDLENSKLFLDSMIENLPLMVFVKDATDLRFTHFNKAAEELLGYTKAEIIGKNDYDFFPKEQADFFIQKDREVLKSTKLVDIPEEAINTKHKGRIFLHTRKISLSDNDGSPLYLLGISEDVTKEKEIDRAKTEFVSIASHQLRTPLTTVNWYSEMLLDEKIKVSQDKRQEYLEKIHSGSVKMVKLVNTLLNVSRIELGTLPLNQQLIDIKSFILGEIDEYKLQLERNKIILVTNFPKDIPSIYIDPKLFTTVFQNLLSNAVKYTSSGGTITIALSVVIIKNIKKILEIRISDTGYGIPKKDQKKIFDKMFRADNIKEMDIEGIGLGLYIVKSTLKYLGGTIRFESEENKGTTFFVILPMDGVKHK